MKQEPKMGLAQPCSVPVAGRIRPEELMRRKLMQKMMARRERRAAQTAGLVRRAV
jgi:hypothetical protein